MSRLIDADAYAAEMKVRQDACKEIMDSAKEDDKWELYGNMSAKFDIFIEAKLTLDNMPTVDAVPVVASDRNKLCPINHGLRCKDIDNCAFWCEWGQCAVKAIAVACADRGRTHG